MNQVGVQLQYPITKSSNWIPVIGQPCDHAPLTSQISVRKTNHQEFCYRHDNNNNNNDDDDDDDDDDESEE